jgi:hypothetical protein
MTNRKKKRRRKPAGGGGGGGNGTRGPAQRQSVVEPSGRDPSSGEKVAARSVDEDGEATPRPRGLFGSTSRMREPSPFPGFRASLARGVAETAGTVPVLIIGFLAVFAIWAAFALVGAVDVMGRFQLAVADALPPMYVVFLDAILVFAPTIAGSSFAGLGLAIGLTVFRVLVLGAIAVLLASRLGVLEGNGRRAFARAVPHLVLIGLAIFGVGVAIPYVIGSQLGNFAAYLLLAGPLIAFHFLIFAPIAAVIDGATFRDAIRRSGRAARLPGGSHLAFTFGYFLFLTALQFLLRPSSVEPATPTILTWTIALAATFLHLSAFAALVYRWVAVRDLKALDQPAGRGAAREAPARGRTRG